MFSKNLIHTSLLIFVEQMRSMIVVNASISQSCIGHMKITSHSMEPSNTNGLPEQPLCPKKYHTGQERHPLEYPHTTNPTKSKHQYHDQLKKSQLAKHFHPKRIYFHRQTLYPSLLSFKLHPPPPQSHHTYTSKQFSKGHLSLQQFTIIIYSTKKNDSYSLKNFIL